MSIIKLAAPRWFKEIKKNPKLIEQLLGNPGSYAAKESANELKSLPIRELTRHRLYDVKPGIGAYDKVPISHPVRRAMYFKGGKSNPNQIYKIHINDELANINPAQVHDHYGINSTKAFVQKQNMRGSTARLILPFRALNSNKKIAVTHVTERSNKKSLLTKPIRSISALRDGDNIPISTVYTFPAKSRNLRSFAGGIKEEKKKGLMRLTSHVRESDVTYGRNRVNASGGAIDPEVWVPGHKFVAGLKR